MTSPALSAFFGHLLAQAEITPDNVVIVHDNAKLPPPRVTKSPASAKSRLRNKAVIMPNDIFAALPSRWETPQPLEKAALKPCKPQRQVSIELPFGDDDGNSNHDSFTSSNGSLNDSKSDLLCDDCDEHYERMMQQQQPQVPPPLPPRWGFEQAQAQQPAPEKISLKLPERSSCRATQVLPMESYSSLASLSSSTTCSSSSLVLVGSSPVKLCRTRST